MTFLPLLIAASHDAERNRAISSYREAKESGLKREIWDLYGVNLDNIPPNFSKSYSRIRLTNFFLLKNVSKREGNMIDDYLLNLVFGGNRIKVDNNLYLVHGSIGLEFIVESEETIETEEEIIFSRRMGLRDTVMVKNRRIKFNYERFDLKKNFPTSQGYSVREPDVVAVIADGLRRVYCDNHSLTGSQVKISTFA